jgi:hypothetical protein
MSLTLFATWTDPCPFPLGAEGLANPRSTKMPKGHHA